MTKVAIIPTKTVEQLEAELLETQIQENRLIMQRIAELEAEECKPVFKTSYSTRPKYNDYDKPFTYESDAAERNASIFQNL